MMLRNTVATTLTYFYPFGNTPAICLTQSLPPEQDADLLLLGCGDVRNVLFTTYASLAADSRKFSFTCCDIEPAIIARNILLLSLIIDDVDDRNSILLWNIYYHIRVDSASILLLSSQATKLLTLSDSLSTWNDGLYGRILQFCDSQTLTQVKSVWRGYVSTGLSQEELRTQNKTLENLLTRAKSTRQVFMGEDTIQLTASRSAAPTGLLALPQLSVLTKEYWDNGGLHMSKTMASTHLNPAVLYSGHRDLTLHYGADPLLGFHLATAYIPLLDSDLSPGSACETGKRIKETAQAELKSWSQAFRQVATRGKAVVRYFSGDALTFAHSLQHYNTSQSTSAGQYTNNWIFSPLDLNGGFYPQTSRTNTALFDVIDTSNLGDHLGIINLLVAAAPLLRLSPASTIYTEVLVQHETSIRATLDSILCGDFNSMTMLLGLAVVETWTNATSSVENDQILSDISSRASGDREKGSKGRQIRTQIPWKLTRTWMSRSVNAEAPALAKFLHMIYRSMFGHEDTRSLLASLSISGVNKVSNPYYNRASFAATLCLLRSCIETNWSAVFSNLLMLIEGDDALSIGRNYLQELNCYLHMMGLYTIDTLSKMPHEILKKPINGPLASWSTLPVVVAVTLEVPRAKIDFFTRMKVGTAGIPSFCCSLQSPSNSHSQWLNQFGAVQSGFGHVKVINSSTPDEHCLTINEDEKAWNGNSPLVVSFWTPTWILLQNEGSTQVSLGFQATVHASLTYLKTLGPSLQLFSARLDDRCVYISQRMPQQQKYPAIAPQIQTVNEHHSASPHIAQSMLSVNFNSSCTSISNISCKIDLHNAAQKLLADKTTTVTLKQELATSIDILIGNTIHCIQHFPRPVSATRSKLRIARKSSYVEVIAPLLSPVEPDKVDTFVYPIVMPTKDIGTIRSPVGLNIHTINLDVSPRICDREPIKLDWMTFHTTTMFSGRERRQREGGFPAPAFKDKTVDFKDGLFSMFMHSTGVQGQKARVFGLCKDVGGVDTLIFVSAPRLDLNDRVVFLDAAVIPLQYTILKDPLFPRVLEKIQTSSTATMVMIKIDDHELKIWKSILPAWAERCRTWKHEKTCEYTKYGIVPLPGGLEDASTPLCSCGVGKLSTEFMKDAVGDFPNLERLLHRYATRIAISPVYHVPYVEDALNINKSTGPRKPTTNASSSSDPASTASGTRCAGCGKTEASLGSDDASLLKCSRCKSAKYCSRDCQKKHWKDHKPVCFAV